MQKAFFLVAVLASALTLAASPVALAQSDPGALAQHYLEALDRGDAAGVLALCADDVVIDGGGGCTAAPCVGKAVLQKELERRAADNPPVHTLLQTYVSGNVVTMRFEATSVRVKKAGVERIIEWGIFEIKGEKIAYMRGGITDRSDPQTARFAEWQRAQQQAR